MYPQENGKKVKLYTGSYNASVMTGDGSVYLGNGQGICLWEFDESTGEVRLEESWPEALNASWLTISPDGKMLYAVNELDDYEGTMGGALSAYRIDMQGYLAADSILPVMGAAPCRPHFPFPQSYVPAVRPSLPVRRLATAENSSCFLHYNWR